MSIINTGQRYTGTNDEVLQQIISRIMFEDDDLRADFVQIALVKGVRGFLTQVVESFWPPDAFNEVVGPFNRIVDSLNLNSDEFAKRWASYEVDEPPF